MEILRFIFVSILNYFKTVILLTIIIYPLLIYICVKIKRGDK